jgi:hypothetical protein
MCGNQLGDRAERKPIKRLDYYGGYRGEWRREPTEPRYLGLTAAQFDIAVLVLIVGAAVAVWLFVFSGTTTARDLLGLEESSSTAVSVPAAPPPPAAPPVADPAVAPPAEAVPPVEAAPAPAPAPAPVLSAEQQLLAASAEAFANVESFRGRFQVAFTADGENVNSGGDIVFQAPDRMHMTMNIGGQTFDMLARGSNMYLRVPHQGWYVLGGAALGFSPEALNGYVSNRGLFDYDAQTAGLLGITQLPDEEIDGGSYLHYRGTIDFRNLSSALPSSILDPSVAQSVRTVSGPVQVDLWLDKETRLPRRHTISMNLDMNGQPVTMDMRMAFTEYNGDVTIPDAPDDARPFDALAAANPPAQTD